MPKVAKVIWDKKRFERERQAQIDAVIAEFGGATDAPAALTRMAETLLKLPPRAAAIHRRR
jgi:hypothetical protein